MICHSDVLVVDIIPGNVLMVDIFAGDIE